MKEALFPLTNTLFIITTDHGEYVLPQSNDIEKSIRKVSGIGKKSQILGSVGKKPFALSLKIAKKIKQNKKIKMYKPLSGSFANVWTEFKIPDLTKKVPDILKVNVAIDKITTHEVKNNFFSKTRIQWRRVVSANHGINETFSTGSQNQKPPQPNS